MLHLIAKTWDVCWLSLSKSNYNYKKFVDKTTEIVLFIKENIANKFPKNKDGRIPSSFVSDPKAIAIFDSDSERSG